MYLCTASRAFSGSRFERKAEQLQDKIRVRGEPMVGASFVARKVCLSRPPTQRRHSGAAQVSRRPTKNWTERVRERSSMGRRYHGQHRRAPLFCFFLVSAAVSGADAAPTVRNDLGVIFLGSAASPDVHFLVTNEEKSVTRVQMRLGGTADCPAMLGPPGWGDVRLSGQAEAELQPGAWFVLSRPTGFARQRLSPNCRAVATLMQSTDARLELLSTSEVGLTRLASRRVAPGITKLAVATSVVAERFSHHHFRTDGIETYLQVQIRITNDSDSPSYVSVYSRGIKCSRGSYEFLLGQDEALSGMSTGPVEIAPHTWAVLSQRIGGLGGSENCAATFRLAEKRNDPQKGGAVLSEFCQVKVQLIPRVRVQY
jgi:hypothetical protein